MKVRSATQWGVLVAMANVVLGFANGRADEKPVVVSLSGRWTFNKELSDDAREKMRKGMEGHRGGPGPGMGGPSGGVGGPQGGGRMGPPPGAGGDENPEEAMQAIFEPAEELTISQTEADIVIEERFGRTRTLHPNGKPYKTDNGLAELKTRWKSGKLVVEKKNARVGKLVESWALAPDRSRILIELSIGGGFGPPLCVKRVYDRAEDARAQ